MANVETYEFVARLDRGICSENDVIELRLTPEATVGKNPVGRPQKALDMDLARSMYVDQVMSLGKVATALGVATLTLRKRFEDEGISVRGRGRPVAKADRFQGGKLGLDPALVESEAAEAALAELLATEAAELEAAEKAAEETVEVRELILV